MRRYEIGQVCAVRLEELGDRFRRYRLRVAQHVEAMTHSLRHWGQCSPLVACLRDERLQVLDGFARWEAAQQVRGMTSLLVRVIAANDQHAKAAIYGLNQTGRRPHELEEAWIVHALVREDGLSQVEVAELLGRHKSWVCRRLALLEKLSPELRQDLEVGLLTPTAARTVARLPAGNQAAAVATARRESLNGDDLEGMVRLLLESTTREQEEFVLTRPRQALERSGAVVRDGCDPRLSAQGNNVSRHLVVLLDRLEWLGNYLECRRWTSLMACDRLVLRPILERFSAEAYRVAGHAGDLVTEMRAHE
jgi:ParB family transcriptional regulator, chromosome partitioning protein